MIRLVCTMTSNLRGFADECKRLLVDVRKTKFYVMAQIDLTMCPFRFQT